MRNAIGAVGATMQTNADKKIVNIAPGQGPAPSDTAAHADPAPTHVQGLSTSTGGSGASRTVPAAFNSLHWTPGFGVLGQDVSYYQGNVDWAGQWSQGSRFAYAKATEGTYSTNQYFSQQYTGSAQQGMIRGAYHFANPSWSSGADQARYFAANGGGWSPDGVTLPPVLDIEYNPYAGRTDLGYTPGDTCYNLAGAPMVQWIKDFGVTMVQLTGRLPMIYTTTDWWTRCTGNSTEFGNFPLWVAAYPSSPSTTPGTLPASWQQYSIWQFSSEGPLAGDSNVWNGDANGLRQFSTVTDAQGAMAAEASQNGWLGAAQTGVNCGLSTGGCYQLYANGTVHWQAFTGAHATKAAIRSTWAAQDYENGRLGYPATDENCGLANGGCYQMFQGGSIHWSSSSGAVLTTWGAIRSNWGSQGFENGRLGYPTSNGESCGQVNGGCYQLFQGGAINYSPATGANISTWGAIRNAWGAQGYQDGRMGYPTSNGESCGQVNGGCYQLFQGGAINYSPATGANISTWGAIRNAWGAQGYQDGRMGYPTSNGESCGQVNGGCYQLFQGGAINYSPATGANISTWGAIRNAWGAQGYQDGRMGYPTSNGESCGQVNGGCFQMFQGGAISYSPATGAHLSPYGAIRTTWGNLGFERGALGYPVTDELCSPATLCHQDFQGGRITWSSTSGTAITYW
ncbi:GH25 family lysozyme [Psychromicrobium xiongbiense]|uniref:GH25 family lysozyme n=1 Tax=Psychromicrobium xiongbiense TaxID=3051184 RepID=UPI0025574EBC|nr:GH25 family lysozyme [Psychromicrobium sp. YIM S02556]